MTSNSSMGNSEMFDRLLQFGCESDRPVFCQRLKTIWDEQGIFCQTYPTITNQILDFYKLYHLVQNKQGYLEISTNRGWKEVSNVLGFGDSGSAAYSVKRNYVRLGLLAYECRFDRAGIDPRSVLELSEMPHTIKKRKRGNTFTRTVIKTPKQQYPTQQEYDEIKPSPPPSSIDNPLRPIPQQLSIHDLHHFPFLLRAGYLADSNRCFDALFFWLSNPRTSSSVNLKYLPGLFHSIIEQYIACLYELFAQTFLQPSSTNDYYVNWFLQSNFRIDECAIGPSSNPRHLQSLFYGSHRYVIKRLLTSNSISEENPDRDHSIITRSSCLSTIIRNLSFIDENDYFANDRSLLDILERILNCSHDQMHDLFTDDFTSDDFIERFTQPSMDERIFDCSLSCQDDCHRQHLFYLLDNTFVTLSNLSALINLSHCHLNTRYRLVNTIVHWITCALSLANEPFISMFREDHIRIFISPRQISLQIFARLCTNQLNVDLIILDLNFSQLKFFGHTLLSIMNSSSSEDPDREYCLMIICSLCKRNDQLVQFFASQLTCLELIFNYLECYEYHQQEYLIATLTSCYQPNSIVPINTSGDMMIDSCIQLLELFALVKEKNYLKSFEYRLLEMSSSIYFEPRILKGFANILFLMKIEMSNCCK